MTIDQGFDSFAVRIVDRNSVAIAVIVIHTYYHFHIMVVVAVTVKTH